MHQGGGRAATEHRAMHHRDTYELGIRNNTADPEAPFGQMQLHILPTVPVWSSCYRLHSTNTLPLATRIWSQSKYQFLGQTILVSV